MSFRERSAWITLVSVLACFGVYYGAILAGWVSPRGHDTLHLLLGSVIALVVLQVALHALAAALSPREARLPRDERERLIQWRSHAFGYYVLVVAVLALFIPGHMGHGVIDLMNFALLDLVLATLAVSVFQIVLFRRGV
jgi:hypothetical protein